MARFGFVFVVLGTLGLVACEDTNSCIDGELSCDSTGLILQGCVDGEITQEQDCAATSLECHADMGTPHCGPAGMGGMEGMGGM